MNKGDYVVSYYGSSKEIDAIGIVEDTEPVYDESKSSFRWTRKVKWLVKNICADIKLINGDTWLSNHDINSLRRVRISNL